MDYWSGSTATFKFHTSIADGNTRTTGPAQVTAGLPGRIPDVTTVRFAEGSVVCRRGGGPNLRLQRRDPLAQPPVRLTELLVLALQFLDAPF